ncbi:MAG TPA: helix-turn-helix domain-containing protein [Candidatus Acidoferrum sp.]|nr:helix-turn-helix domain-containing protein [Candidatus Acidoferrum sp.]
MLEISSVRHIRAIASPTRQALVDVLESTGPGSISQLAKLLNCAPDALYYHVRQLVRNGILRQVEGGLRTGRSGATYDLTAKPTKLKYVPRDKANARAVSQLVGSMLRDSFRAFRRAYSPGIRVRGERRQLWAGRRTSWLTDKQLKILNRAMNRIVSFMDTANRTSAGKTLYAFSFVLSPYQVGKRQFRKLRDGQRTHPDLSFAGRQPEHPGTYKRYAR